MSAIDYNSSICRLSIHKAEALALLGPFSNMD